MLEITIVIVDDDDGQSELVRRQLKRSGLTLPIVALSSGRQALDYVFRRGAYHDRANAALVVLLDLNMPGLNGIDVLRQIKADPKTRRIPVVMLTTAEDPREVNRCYQLGCNAYVTKPVDHVAFADAMGRLGAFLSVLAAPTDGEGRE